MRDDRGPELDALLEDVLATEPCDPELVLRHQRDPGALSPAERAEVEAWLATSAGRDALGAMQELHRSGLPRARVAPPPGRSRGRSAWVMRRAVAVSAAAALVAAWVWWRTDPEAAPSGGVQVARETPEPPLETPPEPPAPLPPAPQPPVVPPSAVDTKQPPPSKQPRTEPEAEPPKPVKPEPILLALAMPEYARPGAQSFGDLDAALRGTGVGGRPFALSPDHVGRTSRASPLLYWYLAQLPEPGTRIWLAIIDESRAETLLETELPAPQRPGLQALDLAGRAQLSPGVDYTWSIALRVDPEQPARDPVAFGWLRHDPPSASERERLSSSGTGERPAVFAALGYFYDALAELEALAQTHLTDPQVERARTVLLRQAGIDPARAGLE